MAASRPAAWIAFSCSFPSSRSTLRVAVWRHLRRAGAVAPKAGLYILPARDGCIETVQWLAQEARTDGADPIVMHVNTFEGLPHVELVEMFHGARREDYAALSERVAALARGIDLGRTDALYALRATAATLREEYEQARKIDYFNAPEGRRLGIALDALSNALSATPRTGSQITSVTKDAYQGRSWVTRPAPFVDRLARAWLIRRFINPTADIRYSNTRAGDEVAFGVIDGDFGHVGNCCTSEVMVEAFGLRNEALNVVAEIVHEIDLHDEPYPRAEVAGVKPCSLAGTRSA